MKPTHSLAQVTRPFHFPRQSMYLLDVFDSLCTSPCSLREIPE